MQWDDSYTVGIKEIDDQHKHLLALFAKIETSMEREGGWAELDAAIDELKEAVRYHFWFEDGLMRMYAFPGGDEHSRKHRNMLKALDDIQVIVLKNSSYDQLRAFLSDWLLKHICSTDRGYADHVLSGGRIVAS